MPKFSMNSSGDGSICERSIPAIMVICGRKLGNFSWGNKAGILVVMRSWRVVVRVLAEAGGTSQSESRSVGFFGVLPDDILWSDCGLAWWLRGGESIWEVLVSAHQ